MKSGDRFLRFYPFADVGGNAKINSIQVDGQVW